MMSTGEGDSPDDDRHGRGEGRRGRKGDSTGQGGGGNKRGSSPRMKKALAEIEDLRVRVSQLELDIQESRRLNKRLAEVTDVVAEVLLPAGQRDETRLRELLANYDKAF